MRATLFTNSFCGLIVTQKLTDAHDISIIVLGFWYALPEQFVGFV